MPIVFPCACGQTLRVADTLAGQSVRCPKCQAVLRAPAAAPAPPPPPAPKPAAPKPVAAPLPVAAAMPAAPALARAVPPPAAPAPAANQFALDEDDTTRPVRSRRPASDEDDEDDDRPRAKRGKKPAAAGSKKTKLVILIASGAALLLGCVSIGGVGAYYLFGGSIGGPAAEEKLVGTWVSDAEENKKTGNIGPDFIGYKITFNPDGTFTMVALLELKGRWKVTGWDGKTAKVRMTVVMFGIDSEPKTATFKFRDPDHVDYDDGHHGFGEQGIKCVLRRAPADEPAAKAAIPGGDGKAGPNNPLGGVFPPGFPQPAIPKDFPQPSIPPALGPSAESKLAGEWEFDQKSIRDPNVLLPTGLKYTFRADHTFLAEAPNLPTQTGKWEVENWDGKTARVKMEGSTGANPAYYVNVTFRDEEHADFNSELGGQRGQLRRPSAPPPRSTGKGSGRPKRPGPNSDETPPNFGQPGPDPQAQKPPENPPPPADQPGGPKTEWTTQTIKPGTVTVSLPGKLFAGGKVPSSSNGTTGLRLEYTIYSVGAPRPSDVQFIRVRYYENPQIPAGKLNGRSVAEVVGSTCLYEFNKSEPAPTRKFAAGGGRQGAVFYHAKNTSYMVMAVGDRRGVLVIICQGRTMKEDDPVAKRILDSVTFPD